MQAGRPRKPKGGRAAAQQDLVMAGQLARNRREVWRTRPGGRHTCAAPQWSLSGGRLPCCVTAIMICTAASGAARGSSRAPAHTRHAVGTHVHPGHAGARAQRAKRVASAAPHDRRPSACAGCPLAWKLLSSTKGSSQVSSCRGWGRTGSGQRGRRARNERPGSGTQSVGGEPPCRAMPGSSHDPACPLHPGSWAPAPCTLNPQSRGPKLASHMMRPKAYTSLALVYFCSLMTWPGRKRGWGGRGVAAQAVTLSTGPAQRRH